MNYFVPKYSIYYLEHEVKQRIKKYNLKNIQLDKNLTSKSPYIHYRIYSNHSNHSNWMFTIYIKNKHILLIENHDSKPITYQKILDFRNDSTNLMYLEHHFERIKIILEISEKI